MKHRAQAEDGPLAGDVNLTIEGADGRWPETVIWKGKQGRRHEYRLQATSIGPENEPVYGFVKSLD